MVSKWKLIYLLLASIFINCSNYTFAKDSETATEIIKLEGLSTSSNHLNIPPYYEINSKGVSKFEIGDRALSIPNKYITGILRNKDRYDTNIGLHIIYPHYVSAVEYDKYPKENEITFQLSYDHNLGNTGTYNHLRYEIEIKLKDKLTNGITVFPEHPEETRFGLLKYIGRNFHGISTILYLKYNQNNDIIYYYKCEWRYPSKNEKDMICYSPGKSLSEGLNMSYTFHHSLISDYKNIENHIVALIESF